jgi:GT2 family glycosyltransferase
MSIPIFIITHNRLDVLVQSFEAVQKLEGDYTIVFTDNKSDYQPLIDWLKEREEEGFLVYWNKTPDLYNELTNTVNKWYSTNTAEYFVFMDPDVVVHGPTDLLAVLQQTLVDHPNKSRAGPIMKWDDIPDYYPLKSVRLACCTRLYKNKPRYSMDWKDGSVTYVHSDIDTTFTMFRKGFRDFRNVHNAIGTLAPYDAVHLDYYIDPNNMSEDQIQYCMRRPKYSHWGGTRLYKFMKK